MSAGSRKYPYRHYPATPAKQSESKFWWAMAFLFFATLISAYVTSSLLR